MKKLLCILVSFLSTGLLIAQDLKLDELLAKNYKAIGQEKFEKVQTIRITGKMSPQPGVELPVTALVERPGRQRIEIDLQGTKLITVVDGKNSWMINPMTGSSDPIVMTADQLISQEKSDRNEPNMNWNYPFINWKENGNKIELVGKVNLDGKSTYNLKITFKDHDVVNYYMDTANFVIVQMKEKKESNGLFTDEETKYSDFREIEGVLLPFKEESITNGQNTMLVISEKVEFNIPVDDAIFKKPAADVK